MSKLDGYKDGDEIEVTFRGLIDGTDGGSLSLRVGRGFSVRFWAYEVEKDDFKITRIDPPLKVGDQVSATGCPDLVEIVAFLSDGRAVLEYDCGDSTNVCARDISCLTRA